MDDILLLDAVERYMKGEMSPKERTFFEDLRKNNPEIDQLVVEQSFFINEVEHYSAVKNFKHTVNMVESELAEEGIISKSRLKTSAKIAYMWKRSQRSIAIAACIAGIISILTASLILIYTKKVSDNNKMDLIARIKNTEKNVNIIQSEIQTGHSQKLIPANPSPDYRATGFLIDGNGYLVTNAHVVNRLKTIYVQNHNGAYFKATSVFADDNADLAILKITDSTFNSISNLPYSIRKNNVDLGEPIFTLGFPRNVIVYGEGYLSARSGNEGDSTAYQITVSVNPGNSGGPVLNRNGEVIGIITSKEKNADGVVYAARSGYIFKLVEHLRKMDVPVLIKTPSSQGLKGLDRTKQVRKMEDYVFMVVGN